MSAPTVDPRGSDVKANLFIAAVVAAGAVAVGESLRHVLRTGLEMRHLAWLGIAVLTVMVGRLSVGLPLPHCRLSFSDALIFLSVLVFGSDLATITGALDGFAASTRAKGTGQKRAFNTAGIAVSVYLSSRVFARMLPQGALSGPRLSPLDLAIPLAALAFSQYLVNTALVSAVVALKEHDSVLTIWRSAPPWSGTAYLAGSVAAAIVFFVVRELGPASACAILPFPAVLYFSYRACLNRLVKVKGVTTN